MKKFVDFSGLDDVTPCQFTKIGVAGCGVVGEATAQALEVQNDVVRYDIKHHPDTLDELLTCDVVFICVSAPTKNGVVNIDNIVDVIEKLSYEQIAVIKSTVPPTTTKMLYDRYEGTRRILHSPEFLTASNAIGDAFYPERIYIGIPDESLRAVAEDVLSLLPVVWAGESEIYDSTTTEMIKYACNGFLTAKVVYANIIHDICDKYGIDSKYVLSSMGADSRIGTSHLAVSADGGRGAGGMCFPKDLAALCLFGSINPQTELLLNSLQIINDFYLKSSGKDIDIIKALTD